jgi:hypothetical protein
MRFVDHLAKSKRDQFQIGLKPVRTRPWAAPRVAGSGRADQVCAQVSPRHRVVVWSGLLHRFRQPVSIVSPGALEARSHHHSCYRICAVLNMDELFYGDLSIGVNKGRHWGRERVASAGRVMVMGKANRKQAEACINIPLCRATRDRLDDKLVGSLAMGTSALIEWALKELSRQGVTIEAGVRNIESRRSWANRKHAARHVRYDFLRMR